MEYEITRLDENSYRISSPMGVHMDLILGKDRALLWDTGYGAGNLRKTVREITDLPLYIVNSHGHVDHACGNYQFKEPIYIHPLDMEVCRCHTARLMRVLALEYGRSLSPKLREEIDTWRLNRLNGLKVQSPEDGSAADSFTAGIGHMQPESYLAQGTGKLLPVTEGHIFDLGGVHLGVVELPGHTMGSIGLMYEEKQVLYVGDAVNDNLWLFLPEAADLATYMNTIKKVMGMKCRKLVFSHRPGYMDPVVLEDYMELAADLAQEGHELYQQGIPFSAPLVPGAAARLCCRRGYRPEDMDKPGYASIVINKDHF